MTARLDASFQNHSQPSTAVAEYSPVKRVPVWTKVWLLLWLIGVAVWLAPEANAAAEETKAKPADVRLVIDVSGSMKQNDPANLRKPAVELLMKLLPEKSKAGVWAFGRYIDMFVPHKEVDESWKREALKNSDKINSQGLFTNIGEALEKASYDFASPNPNYNTSIILLTDGMVDVDKNPDVNQKEWRRIVDEVIPRLKKSGFKVHTIALSDNADKSLLDKLALATDGQSEVAKNADELMKVFLRIFDQAAPSEQLPLSDNHFLVDSSVEEFTALIFRKPGSPDTRLISPDKTEYQFEQETPDAKWYRTDDYDLITLVQPLEGEWQVFADVAPDSRITVVSNLNLRVKALPGNLFVDETAELSLLFQDQGKTVKQPQFLSLLDIEGKLTEKRLGEVWAETFDNSPPPTSGVYATTLDQFGQEGSYEVSVRIDGKSFQRQFRQQINVHQPFTVAIVPGTKEGKETQTISAAANSQLVIPAQTQVVARIKNPEGKSSIKPLVLTPKDQWELVLEPKVEGEYQVFLRISGEDSNKESFNFSPPMMRFSFPAGDDPFAQQEPPKPAPTPEAEEQENTEVADEGEPLEEPVAEEEESSWPLYLALGAGNLVIVLLAFFAYRMVMGGGKGDSLKDLEEAVTDAEKDLESKPAVSSDTPAPDTEIKSEMQALDDLDEIQPIESDLDSIPLDDGFDLSNDDVADADIDIGAADDSNTSGGDDDDELAKAAESLLDDDGMDMGDFSLDDFSPDDDEDKKKE